MQLKESLSEPNHMLPIVRSNMSQTLSCIIQHPMDSTSMKSLSHNPKNSNSSTLIKCFAKNSGPSAKIMASATPTAAPITFGFRNLLETFTVDVHRAENRQLNVPLIAPFTIATSRLDKVENVAIRVELSNGAVGWGEAPILPFVTAEDQTTAMAKASEACAFLRRCPALTLGSMLGEIGGILPGHQFASVSENNLCSCFSTACVVVNHSNNPLLVLSLAVSPLCF